MRSCSIAFSILPLIKIVSTFVLPLPVEIGTDVEFDLQITLPYTVVFPRSFGRRRREVSDASQSQGNSYDIHSKHAAVLSKLDSIFQSAGIADVQCQMRLFCKIHHEPSKYAPLSEAILKHSDEMKGMDAFGNDVPPIFNQFLDVRNVGLHSEGNCTRITDKCQKDPDDDIDWFWFNLVQSFTHIAKMAFN